MLAYQGNTGGGLEIEMRGREVASKVPYMGFLCTVILRRTLPQDQIYQEAVES